MDPFTFRAGDAPLLMSIPHVGEHLPPDLGARMTVAGQKLDDTDWALDRLYDFTSALGIPCLQATHSRYVIDLNRPPDGKPLYPGASNTELVPLETFHDEAIYVHGEDPSEQEIEARKTAFWQPYHERLRRELDGIRQAHGYALLFDCHSIRSRVPRFFDGILPDFNLGTAAGQSCAPGLRDDLADALSGDESYSLAVDGRFTGGYITRSYGAPADNIHAFQLELSIRTYMDEDPEYRWREDLAQNVRPSLRRMVESAMGWGRENLPA